MRNVCVHAVDTCPIVLDTKENGTSVTENSSTRKKKPKVTKILIAFEWGRAQREVFAPVKDAILNNGVFGGHKQLR